MGMKVTVRRAAYKRTEGLCAYCGCVLDPFAFHVDHIDASYVSGRNDQDNLIAACVGCNERKNDKDVEGFRQWHKTTVIYRIDAISKVLVDTAWWMNDGDRQEINDRLLQLKGIVERGNIHFLIDKLRGAE